MFAVPAGYDDLLDAPACTGIWLSIRPRWLPCRVRPECGVRLGRRNCCGSHTPPSGRKYRNVTNQTRRGAIVGPPIPTIRYRYLELRGGGPWRIEA